VNQLGTHKGKNMSTETSTLHEAGPKGPAQQSYMKSQYQTTNNNGGGSSVGPPSTGATPSGYLSGPFFESPALSTSFLDPQNRQMSPPSSTFMSLSLPDTPSNAKMSMDLNFDQNKLKQSAADVVSKFKNAERQIQAQKQRGGNEDGSVGLSASNNNGQRLFPPLEGLSTGPPLIRPPFQSQNSSTGGTNASSNANNNNPPNNNGNVPGPLTTMLKTHRLSASGVPSAEDAYFDMNFPTGSDFAYSFSPGELVRGLGGSSGIPESPLTQNLRMFPYSSGTTAQMAPSWQMMSSSQYGPLPSLATPAFPTGNMGENVGGKGYPEQTTRSGRVSTSKKRRSSDDDSDEGDDKPRKKKKAAKLVDPNEPKITSKHRGVCWYKRTKKWVVQTKVNGKRVHVGYFDDEEKAAEAYKNAVQGIQVKKALEAKQKSLDDAAAAANGNNQRDSLGGDH